MLIRKRRSQNIITSRTCSLMLFLLHHHEHLDPCHLFTPLRRCHGRPHSQHHLADHGSSAAPLPCIWFPAPPRPPRHSHQPWPALQCVRPVTPPAPPPAQQLGHAAPSSRPDTAATHASAVTWPATRWAVPGSAQQVSAARIYASGHERTPLGTLQLVTARAFRKAI
eukprot:366474-Chlamydomonas_euryale.AAC.8